jgi:hypothetical protein
MQRGCELDGIAVSRLKSGAVPRTEGMPPGWLSSGRDAPLVWVDPVDPALSRKAPDHILRDMAGVIVSAHPTLSGVWG